MAKMSWWMALAGYFALVWLFAEVLAPEPGILRGLGGAALFLGMVPWMWGGPEIIEHWLRRLLGKEPRP